MMTLTDRAPMGWMLLVFLLVMVLANIALAAITWYFPDLPVPSAMGIVLAMVASMSAGQSGAKATGRRLTGGEKAGFAFLATVLSTVIGLGVYWGIFLYHGIPFTLENIALVGADAVIPATDMRSILAWVAPIVLLLYLAATYFGVAMGARNQIKLQEKLDARRK